MHISLDSALGRQKRLNSVGESVLQIAPDAAAAYSLRSLTGGDPDVVRVRRESDNTEKDFSGSQIESGEMARWVNEQPTLPLDLRELDTNTGERDGALIEAAAAYSLRKLKEDFTGDVVEVRRNVDGETEGFTAAEVTDGTMESFVKGEEVIYESDFSAGEDGWEVDAGTADGNIDDVGPVGDKRDNCLRFTVDGTSSSTHRVKISAMTAPLKYTVTFDIYIPSTNTNIDGFRTANLTPVETQDSVADEWISVTTTGKAAFGSFQVKARSGGSDSFTGNGTDVFYIRNVKVISYAENELPLDQATGAAAAYSLRNLSSSYTGNVVEVRRSSDDAVQAFTASEVADDTLEDWVSDYQTELSVARNYTTNPYESFTNASSSGFTASNSSGTGFAGFDLSGAPGDEVEVSFELTIRSGSPQIKLRTAYNSSGSASLGTTYTTSGTKTITLTATADFGFIAFSEGDIPADFDVSNFQIVSRSDSGHVRTWYDQSGSDNHAVQTDTAKQPKIVDGGSLVTGGIDFDGTQFLGANGISSSVTGTDQPYSTFSVSKTNTTATQYLLGMGGATTSTPIKNILYHSGGNFGVQQRDDANTLKQSLSISAYSTGTTYLTSTTSGGTVIDFSKNGSLDLDDFDVDVGLLTIDKVNIGARANGDANPLNGSISELIIYDSDQSTKRRAIEENIANHYDITLAAFSRDGTVSTWYDQSGNTPANHATQTDPTKQPKIVNAGSLVSGGLDFDGVDDYLVTTQGYIVELSQNPASVFCVATPDNTNQGYLLTEGDRISPYSSQFILNGASNGSVTVWVNTVGFGSGFPASKTLGGFIYNGTTFQAYLNGSADGSAGTADINAEVFNQTFIGTRADGTTFFFAGKVEELITYKSDQTDNRTAIEANIGETYGITDIPAANDTVNGFVQTWYDQSGNGNDAEQTTASSQPKIVGEVTSGQPHAFLGAIDFDGTDDFLSIDFGSTLSQPNSIFMVHTSDTATESSNEFFDTADSAPRTLFDQSGAYYRMLAGINKVTSLTVDANQKTLVGAFYNATSSFLSKNGTASSTFDVGNAPIDDTSNIGYSTPSGNYYDGKMDEFIIYDTDQSSNRPAIEANINNQYDIY